MVTVKRLYFYSVLGVALVPLLVGLADLLRLIIEAVVGAAGVRALSGAALPREELSWALALVVVAAPIWALHAWLLRGSSHEQEQDVIEARASSARATYVFIVLVVSAAVTCWHLIDLSSAVLATLLARGEPWSVAAPLAGSLVVGTAWLGHVLWRAADFRAAPQRTAGDWLTRMYLYGVLFVAAVLALVEAADVLRTVAQQLVAAQPIWGTSFWWRDALIHPLAVALVASLGWLLHWGLSGRLLLAAPPMGEAHRASRTRTGYLLGVVLLSAAAVLLLGTTSLRHVFVAVLGLWRTSTGSTLVEDIGGPIFMVLPFLVAWWWHVRRASAEALAFGGSDRQRSVVRSGRYVVALVGLAGLAIGLAWELQAILDLIKHGMSGGVVAASVLREDGAPALGALLVGLCMWAPAWLLIERDRMRDPLEFAMATSRRAYLLLVSGLAVVAVMASLAYLVYQFTRLVLGAGHVEDAAWGISILVVAAVVLASHLLTLRSDLRVSATVEATAAMTGVAAGTPGRVVETVLISAPAGSDFKVLNAAIRSELPEGYVMRIVPGAESRAS
jgi:hypothetical protein